MSARPKPTQLRLLHGAQSSKINRNEPVPRSGQIEPPPSLSDAERELFLHYASELDHMRMGAPVDADMLACFVSAVVEFRELSELIKKTGKLVKRANGDAVRNPLMIARRDAALRVHRFGREFGFSPSSRAGIDIGGLAYDDEDNPFA